MQGLLCIVILGLLVGSIQGQTTCPPEGTSDSNCVAYLGSDPCQNGGSCIFKIETHRYTCNCQIPYVGVDCQHDANDGIPDSLELSVPTDTTPSLWDPAGHFPSGHGGLLMLQNYNMETGTVCSNSNSIETAQLLCATLFPQEQFSVVYDFGYVYKGNFDMGVMPIAMSSFYCQSGATNLAECMYTLGDFCTHNEDIVIGCLKPGEEDEWSKMMDYYANPPSGSEPSPAPYPEPSPVEPSPAPYPEPSPVDQADTGTVLYKLEQAGNLYNIQEFEQMSEIYSNDTGFLIDGADAVYGRAGLVYASQLIFASGVDTISPIDMPSVYQLSANVIVTQSNWAMTKSATNESQNVKVLLVWIKQNDDWFIFRNIWNSNTNPDAPH